jgi:hypothetical protein
MRSCFSFAGATPPWLLVLATVALASGCDIHDEPVRTGAGDTLWPQVVERAAAARDLPLREAHARPGIEYVEGFEAGQRRAEAERLPMLLVFRASWCRWSCELAQGPLADRRVATLAHRFVCVTVDADRDAATCKAFGVSGFPTVLVPPARRPPTDWRPPSAPCSRTMQTPGGSRATSTTSTRGKRIKRLPR